MKKLNEREWTSEHEAYHEERKNKCEHCHPEQEESISWTENVAIQELIYTAYSKYGIDPKIIYREYELEFSSVYTAEEIEVFMGEVAV
ncbi:MAG: hypothetical protein EOO00_06260 [Chitinophagaceae bacterium]|nr:MAG: hypothetical protein EOO00_06260 [Chitinophagaceae bacterium]